MFKKIRKHKYGGIHSIYIFLKEHLAINCHHIDTLFSEAIYIYIYIYNINYIVYISVSAHENKVTQSKHR